MNTGREQKAGLEPAGIWKVNRVTPPKPRVCALKELEGTLDHGISWWSRGPVRIMRNNPGHASNACTCKSGLRRGPRRKGQQKNQDLGDCLQCHQGVESRGQGKQLSQWYLITAAYLKWKDRVRFGDVLEGCVCRRPKIAGNSFREGEKPRLCLCG